MLALAKNNFDLMENSLKKPYSILVNSSDGFEDCWEPFFKLFQIYWPDNTAPIFLNTERKIWEYGDLNIICTQVEKKANIERRLTWSECLISALDLLETPLVLYLQEDYFLERRIDSALINQMADLMLTDLKIGHIGLTHFGSAGPFRQSSDSRLWEIAKNSRYRISTQAGLWRVDVLRSYLRAEENGWMFEIFGTRRAKNRNDYFLTLNRDIYNPQVSPVIQYTHTGIIKGQWHEGMPDLFHAHGINLDFDRRGFHKRKPWLLSKIDIGRKLIKNPILLMKFIFGG